jgi:hypothetical protein
VRANGRITLAGSYASRGGNAVAPSCCISSGESAGVALYGAFSGFTLAAPGGTGGTGGAAGAGGWGQWGGAGGGGGGGTFVFNGSVVQTNGITVDTRGGTGAAYGGGGRLVVASNAAVDLSSSLITDARIETYAGRADTNPFIKEGLATPFIPGLLGGAEVYGLLSGLSSESPAIRALLGSAPADSTATLLRLPDGPAGYADIIPGYDMLLLVNLGNQALANPALGIVEAGSDPGWLQPLLQRGAARNPDFGGGGAAALGSLAPHAIYATLIPENGTAFNLGFNGGVVTGLHADIGTPLFLTAQAQLVPEPAVVWLMLGGMVLLIRRAPPRAAPLPEQRNDREPA